VRVGLHHRLLFRVGDGQRDVLDTVARESLHTTLNISADEFVWRRGAAGEARRPTWRSGSQVTLCEVGTSMHTSRGGCEERNLERAGP
jgi:hypothetical protein